MKRVMRASIVPVSACVTLDGLTVSFMNRHPAYVITRRQHRYSPLDVAFLTVRQRLLSAMFADGAAVSSRRQLHPNQRE
jgi:hypothetical protein